MGVLVTRSSVVVDTTPNSFTFTDQTDVATSSTITSAAITVSGINSPATITVTGGTYDINASGSFTSSSGTVNNGDTVRARHTSSGSGSTATNTVVTIGGVSDTFTSTTAAGGSGATYTALVKEAWSGGSLGATWSGWHGPNLNVYDNTRAVSGTQSMKMTFKSVNPTGPVCYGGSGDGHAFGGYNDFPGSLTLPQGSNLWVRWMFYFPSTLSWGYCSGGGDPKICGGENDGFGYNKFIHLGQSGGGVVYIQPRSNRRSATYQSGLAINTDTGLYDDTTFASTAFPLDEWFSFCAHYFLHSTSGWVRLWINDTYQGQSVNGATLSTSGSTMANYGLGDYWNGQHYTDGSAGRSDFWVDELIIATDHSTFDGPNTTDSGGRAYISAATRVADV